MKKKTLLILLFVTIVFFLAKVFSGDLLLPQKIRLGFLTVHYYGFFMVLAIMAGYYVAEKRAKQFGINSKTLEDIVFWLIISGFLGARIYHVLTSFSYYKSSPVEILKVWNGGLSIYGALLGGLICLFIFRKIFNLKSSILNLLDWLTPSLILGQIVGRFGNLFNYEAFGYPTSLPWKMFVPENFRPSGFSAYNFFHPWFLYEVIGNLGILFTILYIERRRKLRGQAPEPSSQAAVNLYGVNLFFTYVLLYNVGRFVLEFLRIDSTFIGSFRLNSIASLVLILASLTAIYRLRNAKIP